MRASHATGSRPLRVAAFTGGATISSRRFRVMQYVRRLAEMGVRIDEHVARFGSWPPANKTLRPLWGIATALNRVIPVAKSYGHDVTLLQREFVSTFVTLERFTHRPRVFDVDDAIWLTNQRADRCFTALAEMCDSVVCGNTFIADHVQRWNRNVIVLPTGVDTDRFQPGRPNEGGRRIIGWSGLNAGVKYLYSIEGALYQVLKTREDLVLRVVSDVKPTFRVLGGSMVEFIQWSPENEVRTIQEMSVGLMPIDDSPWSRGKCSYKMLLYMSCGVPVVVSPAGMNTEVLAYGDVGLGARTEFEWVDAIVSLLDNPARSIAMGAAGRAVIEKHFSLNVLAPRLAAHLKSVRQ